MTNTTESSTTAPVGATGHVSSSVPTGQTPIAAPVRTLGIIALALGVASVLFGFTFLVPIAAIVVGIIGLQREPDSRSFSLWGIVLGAVMSIGWLFVGIAGLAVALPFHFLSSL